MRILVTGDRDWENYETIKETLDQYEISLIINGGAKGADTFAREVAEEFGFKVREFKAHPRYYH